MNPAHVDRTEFLLQSSSFPRRRGRPSRKPAPAQQELCEQRRARYGCAFEEEDSAGGGRLAASRLVWAKVKSHPWWPAQVFDAADASELALRHRGRHGAGARATTTLVSFFWHMTFAWADAARLRPFRDGFPLLAGNNVARRVAAGLSCACNPGEKKEQAVANAGVREGARGAPVDDAGFAREAFRGEAFVDYVSALAVAPGAGADRFELTVAMAQLRAFNRWRGGAPRNIGIIDDGAMEAATATLPTAPKSRKRRRRARRGGGAASDDTSDGNRTTMSRCARGAAITRDDEGAFRCEALVERLRYMDKDVAKLLLAAANPRHHRRRGQQTSKQPAPAAAERAFKPGSEGPPQLAELEAFTQWRRAPSPLNVAGNGGTEAATRPSASLAATKKTEGSIGGDDAAAAADDDDRAGPWRMMSCTRSRENPEACEIGDRDEEQLDGHDLEPSSPEQISTKMFKRRLQVGWKDFVIVVQFVAILLLVCRLIQVNI
ncbi:hypothetical protein BRADI_2g37893v3 [Brachypodium distachyon]|uniref:PWWP domain-containing protein n=1 Tax=Brachypodium distachyon TaxID=15368 RepID=A0A0Q3R2X9_BRADI|nr:hypothetical protein BRADI_2g37893v3 [Brachypodium distachyon]